jgi:transposase
VLTEEQWRRLQEVLPEQKSGPTSTLGDRVFIVGVLFRAKTGMPLRDLPERFGLQPLQQLGEEEALGG